MRSLSFNHRHNKDEVVKVKRKPLHLLSSLAHI